MALRDRHRPGQGWDLDEVPAQAAAGPSAWRHRAATVVVWGGVAGLVVTMIVSLLNLSLFVVTVTRGRQESPQSAGASSSPGRFAATQAVTAWLAAAPSPLPDGRIVSWDGAREMAPSELTDRDGKPVSAPVRFVAEIDTFTLVGKGGRQYTSEVLVSVDPRGGATAASTPSLTAVAPAAGDDWQSGGPWPGLVPAANVPAPLAQAVSGWAAAYASGDASQLRIAVGDPDLSHAYVPLTGVASVKTETVLTAGLSSTDRATAVAQVTLALAWAGQDKPTGPPDPKSSSNAVVTMDVLVERADTAAPVVTAWGAAGSGPSLGRYTNAVDATGRSFPSGAGPTGTAAAPAG